MLSLCHALEMKTSAEDAITTTVAWLETVVIDLNLCPFAKAIHVKNRIRYSVCFATKTGEILAHLTQELRLLHAAPANEIESTLLISTEGLNEFASYNNFLDLCKLLLEELNLEGVIQIATFHPDYQFAGTVYSDVTNCTNRSPYPMLHLLREDSVTRAIETTPDAECIYDRNIATMNKLGQAKMDALMRDARLRS